MCIKCEPTKPNQVSYREVPIRLIQKTYNEKQRIKSYGETVLKVEWFSHSGKFYSYITFGYFDGYQTQTDFIQVADF